MMKCLLWKCSTLRKYNIFFNFFNLLNYKMREKQFKLMLIIYILWPIR